MKLCTPASRFYSDDAASSNGGYRPASYCIELRGTEQDSYGFALPANQVGLKEYRQELMDTQSNKNLHMHTHSMIVYEVLVCTALTYPTLASFLTPRLSQLARKCYRLLSTLPRV